MLKALFDLINELKRRRVIGSVIGYAVVAWVVLQLASIVYEPLGAPPWAMTWTVLLAALGFPIVGALAWSFDLTREGIRRTRNLPGEKSALRRVLPLLAVMVVVCALGYALWGIYRPQLKSSVDRVSATERYLDGRQLWAKRTPRDLASARAAFEAAIKADPGYALPYTGLADTILLQVDYDEESLLKSVQQAEPLIHKAIELDPQLSEAFASFGLLKRSVGQLSGAESMFRQALKLDQDNLNALIWMGGLLGQQGRLIEQREVLERAFALDRFSPVGAVNRANNRSASGDTAAALDILNEALRVDPSSEVVRRSQIVTHMEAGQLEAAYLGAMSLMRDNPNDANNGQLMVNVLAAIGAFDTAVRLIQQGLARIKLSPESERNARMSITISRYAANGKLPSIEAVPTQPDPAVDIDLAATLLSIARLNEQALALLREALDAEHYATIGDISTLLLGAELARRLDDQATFASHLAQAEQLIERALTQGMQMQRLQTQRAIVEGLKHNDAKAIALLDQAHENNYVNMMWLQTDPTLTVLRDSPVFTAWAEAASSKTAELRARLKADAYSVDAPLAALSQAE